MKRLYKTFIVSTLLFGGTAFNLSAQGLFYEWGYALGGTGNETGKLIDTDSDGNVILINDFTADYDADPGLGETTLTNAGNNDVAISKFDSDGNLIWAKSIGGPDADVAYGLDVANNGDIYIAGGFNGTADFDPGTGVENRTSAGAADIFLLKLDANGDFQWVYTNGSSLGEVGKGVEIDNNGDVYLTGFFRQTVDFDLGTGTEELTSMGSADVFVLKLDSNGNFISVYQVGGLNDEDPFDLAIDAANNVYVTGYFQGTVEFDPGTGSTELTSAAGNDLFVLKINASNDFEWAKRVGGSGNDQGTSIVIDNNNDIVIGGYYFGTVDFNPDPVDTDMKTSQGSDDLLIIKLDSSGDYIFGVSAGGVNIDFIQDVNVDDDNNIFSTGVFRNTVDFDPSAAVANLSVNGNNVMADQFYWKLDSDGNYLFAGKLGGTANDHGFVVHTDGQFLYTTGYFNGTADLDFTAGTDIVTSAGGTDASFAKHINCITIETVDVIEACEPVTWIDGVTYTESNNTAVDTIPNMYGCDSIVMLDLTISTTPTSGAENNGDGTLSATGTGDNYQWIDCATNDPISGETATSFAPSADGDYAVIISNNSCADTSDCINFSTVGLSNEKNNTFTAFPNPTNDLFTIESSNTPIELIIVNDAAGREIYRYENSSTTTSVDLSKMQNGVFFVTVFGAENTTATLKVIKQ